ncbi:hypothetical protein R1sor_005522 [Riccia sorocarpa]|uniref:Endonuclease/exonuclease/phosphatase domain-containing protein n=1 Tax=Riccia sorocarpa TaxID=122646 RepID=A0ABD3HP33_9MARC
MSASANGEIPGQNADNTQSQADNERMQLDGDENFTSFAEAEFSNVRSASKLNQDDQVRLSCVGGNRHTFAEGRKKFRNGEELEQDPGSPSNSHNSQDQHSRQSGINKKVQEGAVQSAGQKGGAAVVVSDEHIVTESGVRGDGSAAWVKIETTIGVVGVVSIYASTKLANRIPLWGWLAELIESGRWIILGDYNSVELPEDSHGIANLLNGGELRRWKELVRGGEMVDAYFIAAARKGPRYTRQRVRVDRLEFSRLDRVYFLEGADWFDLALELQHDGKCGLSDHFPVIVKIQLQAVDMERENR